MDTKKFRQIIVSLFAALVVVFLIPIFINIFSTGQPMITIGLCHQVDWLCTLISSVFLVFLVLLVGSVITSLYCLVSYIDYRISWKESITLTEKRDPNGKLYIRAVIENRADRALQFYAVYREILLNGKRDCELEDKVKEHTSRISWSGGSSEDGIKTIDGKDNKTLNIVSLSLGGLTFETAKGERRAGIKKIGKFLLKIYLF